MASRIAEEEKATGSCLPCGAARPSKADARRARLIHAARELFAQNGFHSTGIAQIARQSGVLVGQIYRDFASKEAIMAAIAERDIDQMLADTKLCSAVDRGDPAAVRAWIARFVAGDDVPDVRLVAEIMAESTRNPRVATIVQTVNARLRATILRALEVLAPAPGLAARRALLAEKILTTAAGLFQRRLNREAEDEDALVAALNDGIAHEIDALAASAASPRAARLGGSDPASYARRVHTETSGGNMAVADAHKVASAIEAVVHQADAAYVGVVAILQTLFNKGVLGPDEIRAIADAMVASIPTERHHAFAQSLAGMIPDYKTPRAASISAG